MQISSKYTSLKPHTYSTFAAHVEQVKKEKVQEEERKVKQEAKSAEKKRNRGQRRSAGEGYEMDSATSPSSAPAGQSDSDSNKQTSLFSDGNKMDSALFNFGHSSSETVVGGMSSFNMPDGSQQGIDGSAQIRPILGSHVRRK